LWLGRARRVGGGAAVATQVVDELAVEVGDGDGLVEGEVEGAVDGVLFGGVGEGRVLEHGAAATAEERLDVGAGVADDVGERALRRGKYLAVHEDSPCLALLGSVICTLVEAGPQFVRCMVRCGRTGPKLLEVPGKGHASQVAWPCRAMERWGWEGWICERCKNLK